MSFLCHLGTGLAHTRREEPWARGGGCRAQFCRPEVGGDALVRQLFAEFFPDLADYEETAWVGVARGYSTHSFISNSIFRLSFELPSKIPKLWKLLTFFDDYMLK